MRRRLQGGAPLGAILAVTAIGVLGLLALGALRADGDAAGYAQIRMTETGCYIDPAHSNNALGCAPVGRGAYLISFARSLGGRPVVASRGTCCPGQITATVRSDRTVLVVLPPDETAYPVVGTVLVP